MACYVILLGIALVILSILWDDRRETYGLSAPKPYKGPRYNRHGREVRKDNPPTYRSVA